MFIHANDSSLPVFLQLLFQSMEKTEQSICEITSDFLVNKDSDFCTTNNIDSRIDIQAKCELINYMPADNIHCDFTSYKQVFVKGVSGKKPTINAIVEFFIKLLINNDWAKVKR